MLSYGGTRLTQTSHDATLGFSPWISSQPQVTVCTLKKKKSNKKQTKETTTLSNNTGEKKNSTATNLQSPTKSSCLLLLQESRAWSTKFPVPQVHICAHLVHFRKDARACYIFTSLHSHFSFFAGPPGWAQAGFTRGQCPGPCAALPPSSALIWPDVGHPAFWVLCYRLTLVPPTSHLSTTPLTHTNPPTCSPEKAAFSAWYDNRNGLWPTSSSALYLELLKTPNSVFKTNMPCRHPTSSVISILYHFPWEPPPSMLMICFVILENVNKPVRLPIFFFFSLVDLQYPSFLVIGRKKGREYTQAWASSVPHKEFSSTQYLKPLSSPSSCLESWVPDLESLWHAPSGTGW